MQIDYTTGTFGYRLDAKRVQHEPLARVIQKKPDVPLFVFDAMGGLGRDALIMALLGCDVLFCEAHPTIIPVIQAALEKAGNDPQLGPIIQNNLLFIPEDAGIILKKLKNRELANYSEYPDIIYLDPMFPERKRSSAQVKKEMHWLQEVHAKTTQDYPDYHITNELSIFKLALEIAKQKVIVKRPLYAPEIDTEIKLSYSKKFSSCRFDCYPTTNHNITTR